jgi:hypothetical protein
MDEYERYVKENELSTDNILKYIDDYSIFSHYIGAELEIGVKYTSPLREGDNDPSFALYFSKKYVDTIMYKDHALGLYGSCFHFVSTIFDITFMQALAKINDDFGLGLNGVKPPKNAIKVVFKKSRPVKEDVSIKITSKPYSKEFLTFFGLFGISESTLKYFNAFDVRLIHFIKSNHTSVVYPKELTIAYLIHLEYKIYAPYADRYFKFRNNFPYGYVEGAFQLKFKTNFVIITKSTKECMFFYEHFGWESVAATSESVMISNYFVNEVLRKNYSTIFVWLDNDKAGIRGTEKYIQEYSDMIPIYATDLSHKDPTDTYMHSNDKDYALKKIENNIKNKLCMVEETRLQERRMNMN